MKTDKGNHQQQLKQLELAEKDIANFQHREGETEQDFEIRVIEARHRIHYERAKLQSKWTLLTGIE